MTKNQITKEVFFGKLKELTMMSEELPQEQKEDAVRMFECMCDTPGFIEHTMDCPANDANEVRMVGGTGAPKVTLMALFSAVLDRYLKDIGFSNLLEKTTFIDKTSDIFVEAIAVTVYE